MQADVVCESFEAQLPSPSASRGPPRCGGEQRRRMELDSEGLSPPADEVHDRQLVALSLQIFLVSLDKTLGVRVHRVRFSELSSGTNLRGNKNLMELGAEPSSCRTALRRADFVFEPSA